MAGQRVGLFDLATAVAPRTHTRPPRCPSLERALPSSPPPRRGHARAAMSRTRLCYTRNASTRTGAASPPCDHVGRALLVPDAAATASWWPCHARACTHTCEPSPGSYPASPPFTLVADLEYQAVRACDRVAALPRLRRAATRAPCTDTTPSNPVPAPLLRRLDVPPSVRSLRSSSVPAAAAGSINGDEAGLHLGALDVLPGSSSPPGGGASSS